MLNWDRWRLQALPTPVSLAGMRAAQAAACGLPPGPADDAELLDPEGIGELNHVGRPDTKRAPREYVRPPNPGTVDGDQSAR
jgi:hypothetical protein